MPAAQTKSVGVNQRVSYWKQLFLKQAKEE